MHLVFLNQYYPPDAAPTGVMLAGLAQGLIEAGHEVSVLCAAGGYAGAGDGRSEIEDSGSRIGSGSASSSAIRDPLSAIPYPRIIRIRAFRFGRGTLLGKMLDYASYDAGVAWKLLTMRPAPERIVALTTPPYLSVLARLISRFRGADHAHWVMDVYPDVMAAHGMLGERSILYRILAGLARWGFGGTRCAAVLTLGPDMAERLARRVARCPLASASSVESSVGSDCEREPRHGMQAPPATDDRPPTTVLWVPLWAEVGADGARDSSPAASIGCDSPARQQALPPIPVTFSAAHRPCESGDSRSDLSALALRRQRGWGDDELIVMYSGNMGLGHRFGEILAAAQELAETVGRGGPPRRDVANGVVSGGEDNVRADRPRSADSSPPRRDVNDQAISSHPQGESGRGAAATPDPSHAAAVRRLRFVFFGGGKRRVEVARFVRENPGCGVELYDYAPAERLAAHLRSADVHMASLDPAWTGTMVPSKVQGIFAAGRPVIFIGRAESSIGRWVLESGGGWVVAPADVTGLLAALGEARDPQVRAARGRAAKDFSNKNFDPATNVARMVEVLGKKA
ncbi:MAG: glycosyltransferase family 4 protein [Verrucomicrobia bacterium]|nr:glycosyltransferase family 4 protein [Verrucomicrobiota bacterium]